MNGAATLTLLDAALDYARRGWPVFPCHTPTRGGCSCRDAERCSDIGKHPRTEHGLKDATTDEATIRQWWRRWPDANIGIVTGKASGLLVLDVDPRHGGDATLAELEREHGRLPDTVESLTGGGGRHILFRCPGYPVKSGAGTLGPGLDVKADGGYIVAPPSLHLRGRRYEWEVSSHPDDIPIAEPPAWLLAMLKAESNGNRTAFTIPEAIREGERNATLYRLARSLKAKGLSFEANLAALKAENAAKCDPPLDEREVRGIAAHAYEQPDRPEFAANGDHADKDAAKPEAPDPLSPLRALGDGPTPADVESALRAMVKMLTGADPLTRARVRSEVRELLKARKVPGGAALVDAAMGLLARDGTPAGDNAILLTDPEPWPDPVDGEALLSAIEAVIRRYVALPSEVAVAVALWSLYSHGHDAFDIAPILAITSPTMRCGKSLLLQIMGETVPRALSTSNVSPAALFRAVEAYKPSLLIDEGDAFLTFSEELRGILNSGHSRRGAVVIRCDGETLEAKTFSTWCPKVLALIGKLPSTVADRSIVVRLQRKGRGEVVERFRAAKLRELEPLCMQAARWAADHTDMLRAADPEAPSALNDRAADNWRPLLAIADLAGGEWPGRARRAALTLSGEGEESTEEIGLLLLADLRGIFATDDRLPTASILEKLVALEESPWRHFHKGGSPLTPRDLARLLVPFGVKSRTIRIDDATPKGYVAADFVDAFSRYLASESATPPQSATGAVLQAFSYPPQTPSVADENSDLSMRIQNNVADVADRIPESGGKRETSAQRELFEEDDPGLLAARLADAEEMRTPAWEEVEI